MPPSLNKEAPGEWAESTFVSRQPTTVSSISILTGLQKTLTGEKVLGFCFENSRANLVNDFPLMPDPVAFANSDLLSGKAGETA